MHCSGQAAECGVSHMNEEERWNHIVSLDEELLKGGGHSV